MKRLLIIIICFFFTECAKKIVTVSNKKPIEVQYGKKSKPKSNSIIYFMDGFNHDILIQKNEKNIFQGHLKTDEIISLAGYKYINDLKTGDKLNISFGKEDILIIYNSKFPQIEIYNFPEKIKVNFSRIELKQLE